MSGWSWHHRARSRQECDGHGEGCVTVEGVLMRRSRTSCERNNGVVTPLYAWREGVYRRGVHKKLQWIRTNFPVLREVNAVMPAAFDRRAWQKLLHESYSRTVLRDAIMSVAACRYTERLQLQQRLVCLRSLPVAECLERPSVVTSLFGLTVSGSLYMTRLCAAGSSCEFGAAAARLRLRVQHGGPDLRVVVTRRNPFDLYAGRYYLADADSTGAAMVATPPPLFKSVHLPGQHYRVRQERRLMLVADA